MTDKDCNQQKAFSSAVEITFVESKSILLLLLDKEITSAKERLDIESTAQRSTLQEQRTHIEILDKALSNAQASIIRMEDEVSNQYYLYSYQLVRSPLCRLVIHNLPVLFI